MSNLRQKVLEWIRILGNNSGCHQLPERSFFYKDKQFPVCARCTGVFFGQLTGIILGMCKIFVDSRIALILLLTMGFDWFIQTVGILTSTNMRRAITGFVGGMGLLCLYINGIRWIIKKIYKKK